MMSSLLSRQTYHKLIVRVHEAQDSHFSWARRTVDSLVKVLGVMLRPKVMTLKANVPSGRDKTRHF